MEPFSGLPIDQQSLMVQQLEYMYDEGYREGFKSAGRQTAAKLQLLAENIGKTLEKQGLN